MCTHEEKHCPRCGIAFECKAGNITQCQCYNIAVNDEEQQYISKQFMDCICFNCIMALRTEYNIQKFAATVKNTYGH